MRSILRLVIVALFVGMLTLIPRTATLAAQSVNPGSLNPPPFGDNLTCQATGSGVICNSTGSFSGTVD
jgi:hypothetical protein